MRKSRENMNPLKDSSNNKKTDNSKNMRPVKGSQRPLKGTKHNKSRILFSTIELVFEVVLYFVDL